MGAVGFVSFCMLVGREYVQYKQSVLCHFVCLWGESTYNGSSRFCVILYACGERVRTMQAVSFVSFCMLVGREYVQYKQSVLCHFVCLWGESTYNASSQFCVIWCPMSSCVKRECVQWKQSVLCQFCLLFQGLWNVCVLCVICVVGSFSAVDSCGETIPTDRQTDKNMYQNVRRLLDWLPCSMKANTYSFWLWRPRKEAGYWRLQRFKKPAARSMIVAMAYLLQGPSTTENKTTTHRTHRTHRFVTWCTLCLSSMSWFVC